MSDTPYLGQTTDVILGQEFLTWLWYRSETAPGSFRMPDGSPFGVHMEQRISVQGGEGESLETATVSGSMSPLREARMGLTTGKKVTRALLRFEREADSWQVSLRAEDFSLNSLKTPTVEKDGEGGDDDPDARLLEKIYLIETCLGFLDEVYRQFMEVRLSKGWAEEVRDLRGWMEHEA